jgi:hypothetical protein
VTPAFAGIISSTGMLYYNLEYFEYGYSIQNNILEILLLAWSGFRSLECISTIKI